MMKQTSLAIGSILAVAGAVAWACGPWFPTQMLDDRAATLKAVPQNTFAFEAAHLLPASDDLKAVEVRPFDDAKPAVDLPAEEVRDYTAGAEEWRRATAGCAEAPKGPYGETLSKPPCTTFDADALAQAQARFEAVLALPPAQGKARAAWATYMLGEVHALRAATAAGTPAFAAERDAAVKAFQDVRAHVLSGASDAQGLAVASFGEEARQSLYVGAKACLWVDMRRNDACVAQLAPADLKHAIALYAAQAGHGSLGAVQSLAAIAAAALANPGQADALIDSPVSQRLLVTYALARVAPQTSDGKPDPALSALLDAIGKLGAGKVAAVDRLASLTYELGRYDDAEKLLAHADGPLAAWVRAKLALRKGDREAAALAYAEAVKAFPRADDPKAALEPDSVHQVMGERGVLALARGEYVEAMSHMYDVAAAVGGDGNVYGADGNGVGFGFGNDLAYIAERVLTIDELKTFVDTRAPAMSPQPAAGDKAAAYRPLPLNDRLRWLLARRLMRAERYDDAYAYFPPGIDKRFADIDLRGVAREYAGVVHDGDHAWTDIGKAEARYAAAKIAREHGMDIVGYEQGPDYGDNGGNYQGGSGQSSATLKGESVTEGERQRFADSTAQPDRRFHYRYIAADNAVAAADLLPPRSQAFAATLCMATNWMLQGPPDFNEAKDGDTTKPLNERQRRAKAYYARYVKQGPFVAWASDFGWHCEAPDFARARTLKRAEQIRAVKHVIRHYLPLEIGVFVLGVAGIVWVLVRKRRRKV